MVKHTHGRPDVEYVAFSGKGGHNHGLLAAEWTVMLDHAVLLGGYRSKAAFVDNAVATYPKLSCAEAVRVSISAAFHSQIGNAKSMVIQTIRNKLQELEDQ